MSFDPAAPLGIHADISDELYGESAGVRRTELKVLTNGQPADVHHYRSVGIPDSPALYLGRAVDLSILTPELFPDQFVVAPKVDKRTKVGKGLWEEFMKEAGSRHLLTEAEGELITTCTAAVHASPIARGLLEGTARQLSAWWETSTLGGRKLLCKTRPDAVIEEHGRTIDLKTCADFDDLSFARAVVNYGYDLQAAMNAAGFLANGFEWKEHVIIAVRKPTASVRCDVRCFVWTLDSPWLLRGERVFDALAHRYAEMIADDDRTGWADSVSHLPMPKWTATESADLEAANAEILKGNQ